MAFKKSLVQGAPVDTGGDGAGGGELQGGLQDLEQDHATGSSADHVQVRKKIILFLE